MKPDTAFLLTKCCTQANYLINTFQGATDYWNAKPPLSFWAIIIGFKSFGVNTFGFRAMSGLFSCLTVLMVVVFTRQHSSWLAGFFAGGILITTKNFIMRHNARSGDPDALFIMLATGAVLSTFQARKSMAWLYAACFLLALAFLTKGFHVLPAAATVLILALWMRLYKAMQARQFVLCIVWGLVPVGLWAMSRYLHDGAVFFEKMFFYDLLQRSMHSIEGHGKPVDTYIRYIARDFFDYGIIFLLASSCLLLVHMLKALFSILPTRSDYLLLAQIAVCAGIPVLLFSCATSKLIWYTYPSYPLISILIALGTFHALRVLSSNTRTRYIALGCLVWIGLSWCFQEAAMFSRITREARKNDTTQVAIRTLPTSWKGVRVYLEGAQWEQRHILAAKLHADLTPMDGGRSAWQLATTSTPNPDAILITLTANTFQVQPELPPSAYKAVQ